MAEANIDSRKLNHLEDVIAMTTELFPSGELTITDEIDPEESFSTVLFTIATPGEPKQLANLRKEWCKRIFEIDSNLAPTLQLSIEPLQ